MKFTTNIFLSLTLFLGVISCSNNENQPEVFQPSLGKELVDVASGFSIKKYSEGLREVIIFNPDQSSDTLDTFWLVDTIKYKGVLPSENLLFTPIKSVTCRSTTHIAFFNKLENTHLVKGVGYANYANNLLVKQMLRNKEMVNLTSNDEIDLEIMAKISPQIFLTYPYGNLNENRIESLGIRSIPVLEYLEKTPVQRAEWVKLIGALTAEDEKAEMLFEKIRMNYANMISSISQISKDSFPTVFTGSLYGGKWSAPSGSSLIAQFIKDARGKYVFANHIKEGNVELEFEEFYQRTINTDFFGKVVSENDSITLEKILDGDQRLHKLKSVRNKDIFYCNAKKSDYFGDAIMEPELILQDLILIFHPSVIEGNSSYFKKLAP